MVAKNVNNDPSQTADEDTSQALLKIQSTNYTVQPNVDVYPDELQMLIVALNHSVLSTVMSSYFAVLMTWLSLAGSIAVFNKTTKVVTFQHTNKKKYKLSKKQFAQILNIPNVEPFYEVMNEQVVHMFNDMGHQLPLTRIGDSKKSSPPISMEFPLWNLSSMFDWSKCGFG